MKLRVEPLEAAAFAPYGWTLGEPAEMAPPQARWMGERSAFWHAHPFDAGEGGDTEVLWVRYADARGDVTEMEQHLRTQQALIPLTGELVQIVGLDAAGGGVDPATLRAFRVAPGQGLCMRPRCWHATRVLAGTVLCAMLTRRSTTLDLVRHLDSGAPALESVMATLPPCDWRT